jgi:predicted permease
MSLLVESLLRDLRYAVRAIARMPLLAAVTILSLGAGIGVNTVIFTWVEAVVLKPIPGVEDASAYYLIEPRTGNELFPGMSWLEYGDVRERVRSFRELIAYRATPLYVGQPGEVDRAYGMFVSGNYFEGLGLRPALGRFFRAGEASTPGAEPVAVISYDFWQTRLGGVSDVVSKTLRVNGRDLAIIGVAPRGFLGTVLRLRFDVFMPATMAPVLIAGSRELERRTSRGYSVIGRLQPGTALAQAQSDVGVAMRDLAAAQPETNASVTAEVRPFWKAPRGPQRFLASAIATLQSVTLLLLLTVCGNTANLMLARASVRRREIGLRLAVGSEPWRIGRMLLVENLLLAAGGAAVGVLLAIWGTRALTAVPQTIGLPISLETRVDLMSLGFALLLALACGLVFGAAPALQLARLDPQAALRSGSRAAGRSTFRNVLMAAQAGLALVVLVAAGLFVRSLLDTRGVDPGFRREGVLLAAYDLTGRGMNDERSRAFVSTLLTRLRTLPAVEAAAISSSMPLDIHGLPSRPFTVDGWTRTLPGDELALTNTVTPGYFALMGIPFVAGGDFCDLDDPRGGAQAIVNQAFVSRYLATLEPIGRRIESRGRQYVIVGVVRTSLSNAFGEAPTPAIYLSYRDNPARVGEMHLRTREGAERSLSTGVRGLVRELDPELPVYNLRTLADHVETNLMFRRIPARMFIVLGPMLLVLAAIGIYSVVAYNVSQRTTELGVRLALGATRPRVIAMVMGENLTVVAVGLMTGWLIAFVIIPLVAGGAIDLTIYTGVPLLLLIVAAAATLIPARRAAYGDPITALRAD